MLGSVDWSPLDRSDMEPDKAVSFFDQKMEEINDMCFPWKTHKIRSCDKPWVTNRIKRLLQRKRRAFKHNGKNDNWKVKRDRADNEILTNKIRFFEKVKKNIRENKDPRGYYAAIKLLRTEDAPIPWTVNKIFPGETDPAIAEKAATFFNKISQEFEPIGPPDFPSQ